MDPIFSYVSRVCSSIINASSTGRIIKLFVKLGNSARTEGYVENYVETVKRYLFLTIFFEAGSVASPMNSSRASEERNKRKQRGNVNGLKVDGTQ